MTLQEDRERQPQGPIRVIRGGDSARFFSMTDAIVWVTEGVSEHSMITVPMEIGIEGSLEGDPDGHEIVKLTMDDKTVRVPRHKSFQNTEGVTVSTDYQSFFNLCIKVGEYDEAVLDRGLAWVHLENPNAALMSVGIRRGHGQTPEQLLKRIDSAGTQAIDYLRRVMDGFIPTQN